MQKSIARIHAIPLGIFELFWSQVCSINTVVHPLIGFLTHCTTSVQHQCSIFLNVPVVGYLLTHLLHLLWYCHGFNWLSVALMHDVVVFFVFMWVICITYSLSTDGCLEGHANWYHSS